MEEQFSINNVALVDGRPQTLGLQELLQVFLDHRIEVVRRRSEFRRTKATDRLHLVEGLLIAILDIDEVIAIIRGSDDTAQARHRLIAAFDLTETQTNYILEMPLRRLTKFSRIELEIRVRRPAPHHRRADPRSSTIRRNCARWCPSELAEVAERHADAAAHDPAGVRRRRAVHRRGAPGGARRRRAGCCCPTPGSWPAPSGRAARPPTATAPSTTADRRRRSRDHPGPRRRGRSDGMLRRMSVVDLPALRATLRGTRACPAAPPWVRCWTCPEDVVRRGPGRPDRHRSPWARAHGVVKRLAVEDVPSKAELGPHPARRRRPASVGASVSRDESHHLVLITSDGQLLRFPAEAVRPQGRAAGGMAGIKLGAGDEVLFFGVVDPRARRRGRDRRRSLGARCPARPGTAKVTDGLEYPAKGRATGGVRCHRFRSGEDRLLLAWCGPTPARAASATGVPVDLPEPDSRRDGTGHPPHDSGRRGRRPDHLTANLTAGVKPDRRRQVRLLCRRTYGDSSVSGHR